MGGAKVHCTVSGVGHMLVKSEHAALDAVQRYLSYLPSGSTTVTSSRFASDSRYSGVTSRLLVCR